MASPRGGTDLYGGFSHVFLCISDKKQRALGDRVHILTESMAYTFSSPGGPWRQETAAAAHGRRYQGLPGGYIFVPYPSVYLNPVKKGRKKVGAEKGEPSLDVYFPCS